MTITMGERIHYLRKKSKMTQEDLAKVLGIGRSAILKYEKGHVENLPKATIEKMATVFGVSPSYIMCFDQWDNEEQLSDEVALIERIQAKWGKDAVELLHLFTEMNGDGKSALLEMAENFSCLPKYQK